ncbi:MAG TPA: hypothetical protein V6C81_13695 [Planktothrix sp.]|jgi:hypothetical protein
MTDARPDVGKGGDTITSRNYNAGIRDAVSSMYSVSSENLYKSTAPTGALSDFGNLHLEGFDASSGSSTGAGQSNESCKATTSEASTITALPDHDEQTVSNPNDTSPPAVSETQSAPSSEPTTTQDQPTANSDKTNDNTSTNSDTQYPAYFDYPPTNSNSAQDDHDFLRQAPMVNPGGASMGSYGGSSNASQDPSQAGYNDGQQSASSRNSGEYHHGQMEKAVESNSDYGSNDDTSSGAGSTTPLDFKPENASASDDTNGLIVASSKAHRQPQNNVSPELNQQMAKALPIDLESGMSTQDSLRFYTQSYNGDNAQAAQAGNQELAAAGQEVYLSNDDNGNLTMRFGSPSEALQEGATNYTARLKMERTLNQMASGTVSFSDQ